MSQFLGIDTSNYTSSVALFDERSDVMIHTRRLLEVGKGQIGLRQSDVVFAHVKNVPDLVDDIFLKVEDREICAVGVSTRPRDEVKSYMPCFLVGQMIARSIASVLEIPCYEMSHQAGHIMSALYSAKRMDLLQRDFIAFHVSGGTTEAVMVSPSADRIFDVKVIARSLDLKAGQLIDRVGCMLGFDFPAGQQMDSLAYEYDMKKPKLKGVNCCLSGVENICKKMYEEHRSSSEISAYCITYVMKTLECMCDALLLEYGNMPVVFSGGVMSNSIISEKFKKKYDAVFANAQFSSDNATGVAMLARRMYREGR